MRVARAAPLGMGLLMAAALGATLAATAVAQETTEALVVQADRPEVIRSFHLSTNPISRDGG